jgi:hypothetical protein
MYASFKGGGRQTGKGADQYTQYQYKISVGDMPYSPL